MPGGYLVHDLRLAWRGLMRSKPFTAAAVLTLAVGIGGTTAMFALVQGVLLRRMPVRDQDRLVVAWKAAPQGGFAHWPFHVEEIEVIGRESRLLERVAGVSYVGAWPAVVVEDGQVTRVAATSVTGSYFDALGVAPVLGRALQPADDRAQAEKVLVITHGLWQRRYGGSRDVIGRRLTLRDGPFTIVGVMPRDFAYPSGVEAWMTVEALASLSSNPTFRETVRRENDLVARVRAGATRAQVAGELEALIAPLEADARFDYLPKGMRPVVRPYEDLVVGEVRPAMAVLFAAVGLLLLIASANVANLLLVRGEARRTDIAVRAALGATRGRIASLLLAESLVLALMAALAGLAGAKWLLQGVVALVPGGLPRVESVRIDGAVMLFTTLVGFLSAALAGLAPALYAARTDLAAQLRSGRQPGGGGARRGRRALVMAQVALAVTVVAAAGLLTRSLMRLQAVDMGLRPDRLVLVPLDLPDTEDERDSRRLRMLDELVARLRAAPAIEDATPITTLPFAGKLGWDASYSTEQQSEEDAKANPSHNFEAIYPSHFATLGIPVLKGRAFHDTDRPGAPDVVIVSDDLTARLWPGQDPIGKRLKLAGSWRTVVGVVKPTRYRELAVAQPTLYLPAPQFIVAASAIIVRTELPPAAVADLARGHAQALGPRVRVMSAVPFRQLLAAPLARPRFNAFLIGLFGGASLLLAAVGLYAVMAAYVRGRQHEMGIRLTLGATPSAVSRLVLGEGLRLAVAGAALGLAVAAGATRALEGLLFASSPLDPASLLGAAGLLVGAAALACYLPARQASRVDPATVLRAG